MTAVVEPSLAAAKPDQKFQFERHGYFVADRADHGVGGKVVFQPGDGVEGSLELIAIPTLCACLMPRTNRLC